VKTLKIEEMLQRDRELHTVDLLHGVLIAAVKERACARLRKREWVHWIGACGITMSSLVKGH
jgi:hypothetical protein